jgi:hypothetical protein
VILTFLADRSGKVGRPYSTAQYPCTSDMCDELEPPWLILQVAL